MQPLIGKERFDGTVTRTNKGIFDTKAKCSMPILHIGLKGDSTDGNYNLKLIQPLISRCNNSEQLSDKYL